jgi:glycosyltransferase involved in cell wall biosynthesis
VQLCLQLRALGLDVRFACRRTPGLTARPTEPADKASSTRRESLSSRSIAAHAAERGLTALTSFHLNRYFNVHENFQDVRLISRYINHEKIDVVHTHLTHDHFIGGVAARHSPRKTRVIRTNHKGVALPFHAGNCFLMRLLTDGYVTFTKTGFERDKRTFGLKSERMLHLDPSVELGRFQDTAGGAKARERLGIPGDAVVAGIVARIQRHRRFDVLLKAFQAAVGQEPMLHLLVIGRGTHRRKVAMEPAKELGLKDHVIFAGYRTTDFVETLAAMDFKIFLVPGSDGTCRAVREVMAMGKPCIVAHRGMLPELVIDGRTGLVIEDSFENLAQAILRLARDEKLRKELGARAEEEARRRFDPAVQVQQVVDFYRRILTAPE